ncbi:heme exporter protein CcmB [Bacillus sp. B15-48]|uniref:heme exporter protein CcmB n=1 Tax=Bacillus sp. B15-48 TaxID=1548601 RepID=UPI00193F3F4E|nr:heme exporter protein CcmB [Bacillus sp. B15-48]MBM4762627.1 transcriptional regulator [Bacillus sp. B15-48]
MKSIITDAFTIAGKDLKSELRSKQTIGMMVVFSALVIIVFSFAFDPTNNMIKAVIPGLIWLITVFAGILGLNRSFTSERENDCFTGLRAAPIDSSSIYLGKVIANFSLVSLVQIISVPLLFLLFGYQFSGSYLWFTLILFTGTFGFIIVGTFLAALAANANNSEMLLPVLLLPLISPLIIAGVQAIRLILENEHIQDAMSWLQLMVAYDLLFLAACFLLFEYITEGS